MTWENIHNKSKHLPRMKDFRIWCFKNGFENGGHPISFSKSDIKTIFGYLQGYAHTEKISLFIAEVVHTSGGDIIGQRIFTHYWTGIIKEAVKGNWIDPKIDKNSDNYLSPVEAMVWVAAQYFEMGA